VVLQRNPSWVITVLSRPKPIKGCSANWRRSYNCFHLLQLQTWCRSGETRRNKEGRRMVVLHPGKFKTLQF